MSKRQKKKRKSLQNTQHGNGNRLNGKENKSPFTYPYFNINKRSCNYPFTFFQFWEKVFMGVPKGTPIFLLLKFERKTQEKAQPEIPSKKKGKR